MADQFINIADPNTGEIGSVPHDQYQTALEQGYRVATPEEVHKAKVETKYGGLGQQVVGGVEGAAEATTFGASSALERAAGVPAEDIAGRREAGWGHAIGQGVGLLIPGAPEANALKAIGEGIGAQVGTRIGSAAAKMAAENALFQGGDEVGKMLAGDPHASAGTAMLNVGLAGVLGGGIGLGSGAAGAMWDAAFKPQTERVLSALQKRMGGADVVSTEVADSLKAIGIDTPPEIRANLSEMPELQHMAKTLEQSDTTAGGLQFQETLKGYKHQLNESVVRSLGREPTQLDGLGELSKHEAGKAIGHAMADEYEQAVGPLSAEYEELRNKFGGVELRPDVTETHEFPQEPVATTGSMGETVWKQPPPQSTTNFLPGHMSEAAEQISQLAQEQGWTISPSSEIMGHVRRVVGELHNVKTMDDLGNYIKTIGDTMQSNPLNKPLMRAGGMLKAELRKIEEAAIHENLAKDAPELLGRYEMVRKAYGEASRMKDAIDERLGTRASTAGFGKALREMAGGDAETLLRRVSGASDAEVLTLMQEHFPAAAAKLREYHVDSLLKSATERAKGDDIINANALLKAVAKMSPEMRQFALTPEALNRLAATDTVLSQFNRLPHNFSNTARTLDKLSGKMAGSTLGAITMLTGHHPLLAGAAMALPKFLGRDVPDATRLAMLKFMGSTEQISGKGFAGMVDYIAHTMAGETKLTRATRALFDAGAKVLPESQMSEAKQKRIDKLVGQNSPEMLKVGEGVSHYLPDHGTALAEMSGNAMRTLEALKPMPKPGLPLDKPVAPTAAETALYHRAMGIAEQPLTILHNIKTGQLQMQDVQILQQMYPRLYQRMTEKVMNELVDRHSDDEPIPYNTRLGLSMFLQQPLDGTMTPQGIQAGQVALQSGQLAQTPPQDQTKPSKTGMGKIKVAEMSMLPSQAAAYRKTSKA